MGSAITTIVARSSPAEAEQALLNRPLVLAVALKHAAKESRFLAFGRTDSARQFAVVFTVRVNRVRVISARPRTGR